MATNYVTLADFEVATAEQAQDLFIDSSIVKVDAAADLASLPNEVKTAYVLNTGVVMARNIANAWVPLGGVATVAESAPANPQVGQMWVKPSEVLPVATRGALVVTGSGTITATAWGTQLPSSTTVSVVVAKAAVYSINMSGFVQSAAGAATDNRARLAWTGALTGNSFDHLGGLHGALIQGASPASNTLAPYNRQSLSFHLALPVGTTTFKIEAHKTGAGTGGAVNYVLLEAIPVAWADEYAAGVS